MQLQMTREQETKKTAAMKEVLYLPDGTALEVLSFGYKNALANTLWFNTVSYFGKHYKSDKDYKWLEHMCDLITDLNPRAEHVFSFCSTMLSWEVNHPQPAYDILTKAIKTRPDYWRYYYLRGFVSWYFLEDVESAREDFTHGAELPDAPAFLARLAASKMSLSDPQAAIRFLTKLIETTEDPNQRASLEDKLRQTQFQLQYDSIEEKIAEYSRTFGTAPSALKELMAKGLLPNKQNAITDPYGGRFFIERETNTLKTTSGRKPRSRKTDGGKTNESS
jgi:tetratricopeptide (TPR) repeat protein